MDAQSLKQLTMQWEILHNQADDGQTDNAEHKAHVMHPNNNKEVSLETDKERNQMIRGYFMWMMPTEHDRILDYFQQTQGHIWLMTILHMVMGEESNDVMSIHQNQEVRCRHIACDDKVDPITTRNTPTNMMSKRSLSPVKGENKTRSGSISCRLVWLGINT